MRRFLFNHVFLTAVRIPPGQKESTPQGGAFFLKTNPNFDTNAPPFEIRGCKIILGCANSE